jgi:RND family efflux transporter MFP subunit
MHSARFKSIVALVIVTAGAATWLAAGEPGKGLAANTRPSEERTLSFVRPGLIIEMSVKKGDTVKKDQVVARQDDKEERELLKAAEAEANSTTEIEAETAVLAADREELKNKRSAASAMEVREAELKVVVDEARIKLAIFKKQQAEFKFAANKAAIEKSKLISPIDGVVADVVMKEGEATNGQDMKVMRIVQNDPLKVEVPVPLQQARALKTDDPVQVLFSDGKTRVGKVVQKDIQADPASGTLNVRVDIPNPERLESGETVRVTFGPSAVAGMPAGR